MKRNKESNYRQKIISKYYMNKEEQKQMDNLVQHPSYPFVKTTYKELYLKPRNETLLFLVCNVNQCRILIQRCGVDIKIDNRYKSFTDVLDEISQKFKEAVEYAN
jgi:hypothetical protein